MKQCPPQRPAHLVQPHRPPRQETNLLSRTSQCNLVPGSLVAEYEYDKNKKRIAAEGNRVRPVRPFLVTSNPPNRAEYVDPGGLRRTKMATALYLPSLPVSYAWSFCTQQEERQGVPHMETG